MLSSASSRDPMNKSDRVPQTLQALFIASSRGKVVNKPPPNGVGSRMFARVWTKKTKRDEMEDGSNHSLRKNRLNGGSNHSQMKNRLGNGSSHSLVKKRSKNSSVAAPRDSVASQATLTEEQKNNICPQAYLSSLLRTRDYSNNAFSSLETAYYNKPTPLQIASYGNAMLKTIRENDANSLKEMLDAGLSPNACNKYGESIVHVVCRTGNKECFQMLLEHGCSVQVADDYGRTPLHDAFFCETTNFEIVDLILERDVRLLNVKDSRGHLPVNYARKEQWDAWVKFFMARKDKFWPGRCLKNDGVQADPALALQGPNTRPLPDPEDASSNLELVQMVADGKMKPIEAMLLMDDDDDESFFGEDDDDCTNDDYTTATNDYCSSVDGSFVGTKHYEEESESMFDEEAMEDILGCLRKGKAIVWAH